MIYPRTGKRGAPQAFARKLFDIVSSEDEAVSWGPNGTGFVITDLDLFTNKILMKYFKHCKFSSFQRQLNLYGFRKVHKGPSAGSYLNPFFQRDRPELLAKIVRAKQKSKRDRERELKKTPDTSSSGKALRPSQRRAGGANNSNSRRKASKTIVLPVAQRLAPKIEPHAGVFPRPSLGTRMRSSSSDSADTPSRPLQVPLFSEICEQTRQRSGGEGTTGKGVHRVSRQQSQQRVHRQQGQQSQSSFFSFDWLLSPTMSLSGDDRLPADEVDREVRSIEEGRHDVLLHKQDFHALKGGMSPPQQGQSAWSLFEPFQPFPDLLEPGQSGKTVKTTTTTTTTTIGPLTSPSRHQGHLSASMTRVLREALDDSPSTLRLPHQQVREAYRKGEQSSEGNGRQQQQQQQEEHQHQQQTGHAMVSSDSDSEGEGATDTSGEEEDDSNLYFDDLASTFRLLDITPPSSPTSVREEGSPLPCSSELEVDFDEVFALLA